MIDTILRDDRNTLYRGTRVVSCWWRGNLKEPVLCRVGSPLIQDLSKKIRIYPDPNPDP
jgi:hypothetical protein